MEKKNITDFSDARTLEKYSSAFTLSDMEIFIFPELFYPLVLANIMSPVLWEWKNDPWFTDIHKKSFNYKTNRIKQFIIQNFVFNLDLATWGLTTKPKEIARFRDFFDIDLLKQSNALFGYEGDKYYFDIDIRKHFGLDKYNSDIIPYWKTETIEAMTAFRHKENFLTGAGECVSLSALYAAAMFVVGRIPLEKIFLIATPLHSQNFILEKEGLITNNRRIVTKNMWFNGTSLSEKARRALKNEKVTLVSHISGYIHIVYKEATIDRKSYDRFSSSLREFLVSDLTIPIFLNFLRFHSRYKFLFQFRCECSGIYKYISLEKIFEYEHTSKYSISDDTRKLLINDIESDEFHLSQIQDRIILNDVEEIIAKNKGNSLKDIEEQIISSNRQIAESLLHEMFSDISDFLITDPKLPDSNKNYVNYNAPVISVDDNRDEIIEIITESAKNSELSQLTLYVYRMMDKIDWLPFVKAAVERNPVCFEDLEGKSIKEVFDILNVMPNESIYDGQRLAQPDEVWNFRRGDGIEKAFLLADYSLHKDWNEKITITIDNQDVSIALKEGKFNFRSGKSFRKTLEIKMDNKAGKSTLDLAER